MSDDTSLLKFECHLWGQGVTRLAAIDEAGRGPLAGPVVSSAVIFDRAFVEAEEHGLLEGLIDSKQLTASKREAFHEILTKSPFIEFGVGIASAGEIDSINILKATHLSMARAVENLKSPPDHIIVDGLPVKGLPCPSTAIVRGDALSLSIAAASVIAKVVRDGMMKELHQRYPQYGFDKHKGYGSRKHFQALMEHGPCPAHRMTFRPVRDAADIRRRGEKG